MIHFYLWQNPTWANWIHFPIWCMFSFQKGVTLFCGSILRSIFKPKRPECWKRRSSHGWPQVGAAVGLLLQKRKRLSVFFYSEHLSARLAYESFQLTTFGNTKQLFSFLSSYQCGFYVLILIGQQFIHHFSKLYHNILSLNPSGFFFFRTILPLNQIFSRLVHSRLSILLTNPLTTQRKLKWTTASDPDRKPDTLVEYLNTIT